MVLWLQVCTVYNFIRRGYIYIYIYVIIIDSTDALTVAGTLDILFCNIHSFPLKPNLVSIPYTIMNYFFINYKTDVTVDK